MMKYAAQVTAVGLAGLVALKVAALLVFPIVGLVIGLLGLFLKIALVIFVGYFVLSLIKRLRGEDEVETEVEVEEVEETE